jgi:hypothetical protein
VTVPPQSPARRRERASNQERAATREAATRDPDRAAAREEKRAQQSWVEGAAPALPVRATRPEEVVFHLGPTNSGKTYDSLQALAANGSGVYAAPPSSTSTGRARSASCTAPCPRRPAARSSTGSPGVSWTCWSPPT